MGARKQRDARRGPWSRGRILLLGLTALCLYVFAPSIAEVFSAYDRLGDVQPLWLIPGIACAVGSFGCVWVVQAIALGSRDWFCIITTQLAGNAFNRITPGGGATGTAMQVSMLADADFDTPHTATALATQSILSTAAIVALPAFALPFMLAGVAIPPDLLATLWLAIPVFLLMAALGISMFASDRPLHFVGRVVTKFRERHHQRHPERHHHLLPESPDDEGLNLGEHLLRSRDEIRAQLSPRWRLAVGASVGRWLLEYAVLVLTLYGVGASPSPALVLLAFVAGSLLGLLPFTPGGLGFVEAGLAGTLALAGISTGDALVATLVFRLLTFWLPIPAGSIAAFVFRRRHPRVSPPGRRTG